MTGTYFWNLKRLEINTERCYCNLQRLIRCQLNKLYYPEKAKNNGWEYLTFFTDIQWVYQTNVNRLRIVILRCPTVIINKSIRYKENSLSWNKKQNISYRDKSYRDKRAAYFQLRSFIKIIKNSLSIILIKSYISLASIKKMFSRTRCQG